MVFILYNYNNVLLSSLIHKKIIYIVLIVFNIKKIKKFKKKLKNLIKKES
jgi:hypothetical protein